MDISRMSCGSQRHSTYASDGSDKQGEGPDTPLFRLFWLGQVELAQERDESFSHIP